MQKDIGCFLLALEKISPATRTKRFGKALQRPEPPNQSWEFVPQWSALNPQSWEPVPQSSEFIPQSSELAPQSWEFVPQSSELLPQWSEFVPQSSELLPQWSQSPPQLQDCEKSLLCLPLFYTTAGSSTASWSVGVLNNGIPRRIRRSWIGVWILLRAGLWTQSL